MEATIRASIACHYTERIQQRSIGYMAPTIRTRSRLLYLRQVTDDTHHIVMVVNTQCIFDRQAQFIRECRCGRLAYLISYPQSLLANHYVLSSILASNQYAQCGWCFINGRPIPSELDRHPSSSTGDRRPLHQLLHKVYLLCLQFTIEH